MLKGKVQMGSNVQTKLRWDQDTLEDCSPKDHVWGWSIHASKVIHYDKDKVDDECLLEMLCQCLLDKQAGAPAWGGENSKVKHGVCFVSSMIVCVLQCCFKMDDKVTTSLIMPYGCRLIGCCFKSRRLMQITLV